MGLQAGYAIRNYNLNTVQFGDELELGVTQETVEGINAGWFDLNSGLVLYNSKYWVGLALGHLTKPKSLASFQKTLR